MARRPLTAHSALALGALAAILLALGAIAPASRAAEPVFPALTGRVVDQADLLSAEEEAALTIDLEALEAKSTDQLVVVTLASLQGLAIEDFGYRLGRHWGIGQQGKDNGVLLIVAPNERKVRIEIGSGLEPVLTDALSKLIIENAILPRFKQNDYPGGIKAGVRDIIAVLTGDAEAVRLRAQGRRDDASDIFKAVFVLIWIAIFLIIVWAAIQSARHGAKGTSSGWTPGSSAGGRSSGGWSGGGGFSGGGGGFSGGGASGSW